MSATATSAPTWEALHKERSDENDERRRSIEAQVLSPDDRRSQLGSIKRVQLALYDVWKDVNALRAAERELSRPEIVAAPKMRAVCDDLAGQLDEAETSFAEAAATYERGRRVDVQLERDRLRQEIDDVGAMLDFVEYGAKDARGAGLSYGIGRRMAGVLAERGLTMADLERPALVTRERLRADAIGRAEDARARLVAFFGREGI